MADRGADRFAESGRATPTKVKGVFKNIAKTYDLINVLGSLGIDRIWRRVTVRMSGARPEDRVLDIAAGTGDLAIAMARRACPREIVALDFTPEMLQIAEVKVARRKDLRSKFAFQVGDAQALPFENESFDIATVGFGVRNLSDRAANFREVLRVLKPGGRYVILEMSRPTFGPWRALYYLYLGTVLPFLGRVIAGQRESYEYLNASIRTFPRQEALAEELDSAGFSQVEWRNLTGGIVAVHVARK